MKFSFICQLLLKLQQFLTRSQLKKKYSNKSICAAQQWRCKTCLNQFTRRVPDVYFRSTTGFGSVIIRPILRQFNHVSLSRPTMFKNVRNSALTHEYSTAAGRKAPFPSSGHLHNSSPSLIALFSNSSTTRSSSTSTPRFFSLKRQLRRSSRPKLTTAAHENDNAALRLVSCVCCFDSVRES